MKRFLAYVALTSALVFTQPMFFNFASAAPQLDQSKLEPFTGAGTAINSEFVAQVITVGKSGILDSVDFAIRKFDGSTFGDVTVEIREVTSGVPNSTVLGSKNFANAAISPADQE